MFVLDPAGAGLLLKPPAGVGWVQVAWIVVTASAGIAALAGGAQNWAIVRCRLWERLALIVAGLLLVYPHGWADIVGLVADRRWCCWRSGCAGCSRALGERRLTGAGREPGPQT